MATYTERLELIKEFLEDTSDKRIEHINWDKIDLLFHPTKGHIHDGEDSPEVYIDWTDIWAEFQKVWKVIESIQVDQKKQKYFNEQFYADYLRHNHTGVETIFTETFTDFRNTINEETSMILNPQYRFLTLPDNYIRNRWYNWVGRPFYLNQDPDPDVTPTRAEANIIATNRGEFTPYLVVSDNPEVKNGKYIDSIPGQFVETTRTDTTSRSVYSMAGRGADKRNGTNKVPHRAYHWYGKGLPPISRFVRRFAENREFSPAEYYRSFTKSIAGERESVVDKEDMITTDLPFTETENTYEQIPINVDARPLYSGKAPLSYYKKTNTFYWFDIAEGVFYEIPREELGPIHEDNMVEVAATEDADGFIYILKSWVEETENPAGHFHLKHQIIKWGGEEDITNFTEGKIWKSGTFKRRYWLPHVIAPTHLEISESKLYVYTEISWQHRRNEGSGEVINYYEETPNYQWFPFGKIYGNTYKQSEYVTMIYFNPAILGTLLSMNLTDENWIPRGTADLIDGAFPFNNSHAISDRAFIRDFQGGNDNIYLGMEGEEMVFYQSFIPYDGEEVLNYQYWEDPVWLEQNTDRCWHGIIRYNILTGEKVMVQGDLPFRVNSNGTLFEEEAWISDGVELVKQWVVEEQTEANEVGTASLARSIIATVNNQKPTNKKVVGSFWVARASSRAKVASNKGNIYASSSATVRVNITNGNHTAVNARASSSVRVVSKNGGRAVASSKASVNVKSNGTSIRASSHAVVRVGGTQNTKPNKTRPPKNSPPDVSCKKINKGIETGENACMYFKFNLGEIDPYDTIRIHVNARSGGRYPSGGGVPFEGKEFKGYRVVYWTASDWSLVHNGHVDNDIDATPIVDTSGVSNNGVLNLCIRSDRRSDAKRNIISTLDLNYIYVTVERQGYIYKYTWDDMPQGMQAAMNIRARAPEPDTNQPGAGQNGIEILGIQTNVLSSK